MVEETKELEALTRNVQNLFGADHRGRPVPARGAPDRGRERRRPERALAPRRLDDAPEDRGEAGSCSRPPTSRSGCARSRAILSRELEVIELGSKIQSQVQSEMEKGQREYFLRQQLKAIQEELGEGDEQQAEVNELRERLAELELPEDVRKAAERELSRLEKLPPAAAEYGVIRTYLDWILTLPWDKTTEDNLDLDQARHDPRRGPLRPREGQGADHRVPRRLEAEGRRLRPDPLLRRPARRRQDLARPVDRAHARAEVRAHLGRRRPRRGRDPRPPAHVHRRDARARSSARCATPSRGTRSS